MTADQEFVRGDQTPPMSPGKRILRVAGSPGRFVKAQLREGSINASVFSLVIICLGAGTLTIPQIYYLNGFVLGSILICFGASMSAFTGYLIAYCCAKTKATCYEECAMATYGKWMQTLTSICMICCNIGFNVSYMVLFKSLMPYSIELAMGPGKNLPGWCDQSVNGQMFWLILFTVGILKHFVKTFVLVSINSNFITKKVNSLEIYQRFFCDDLDLHYAGYCL